MNSCKIALPNPGNRILSTRQVIATGFFIAGIESLSEDSVSDVSFRSLEVVLGTVDMVVLHEPWPRNMGRPYAPAGWCFRWTLGDGVGVEPPLYTTCMIHSVYIPNTILHWHFTSQTSQTLSENVFRNNN